MGETPLDEDKLFLGHSTLLVYRRLTITSQYLDRRKNVGHQKERSGHRVVWLSITNKDLMGRGSNRKKA